MVTFENGKIEITRTQYEGKVSFGPSKSRFIRYILLSIFEKSKTTLVLPENSVISSDCKIALGMLPVFSCSFKRKENEILIDSENLKIPQKAELNVGESATLLRFFAIVSALFDNEFSFTTEGTLKNRNFSELILALNSIGVEASYENGIFRKKGKFDPGKLKNISVNTKNTSQIAGGFLLLGAFSGIDCNVNIGENPSSLKYIIMTMDCLQKFDVKTLFNEKNGNIFVSGCSTKKGNRKIYVPEDESGKAVFKCAGLLSNVNIRFDETADCFQPDSDFLNVATGILNGKSVVSLKNFPDLVFLLTLVACVSNHKVKFTECGRLSDKESNRFENAVEFAGEMCVNAEVIDEESFVVHGKKTINPSVIDAHNDHRLVFAAWVSSILAGDKIVITNGLNSSDKSFPDFFEKIKELESSK